MHVWTVSAARPRRDGQMRSGGTVPARHLRFSHVALAVLTVLATSARADIIVGPGAVAGPVNVSVEATFIVGSTTVTSGGATAGTNVTGSTLTIDSLLGPAPGSILVQTLNGNALQANGGTIGISNLVQALTQNGHALLANGAASSVVANGTSVQTTGTGAGLVAIGGSITATGVTVDNLGNSTPTVSAGHGAIAEGGGTVRLHAGTSIATGAFNAVGLGASGASSQVIADAVVPVTMNGRGAQGVYLHDGGQVGLAAGMTLQLNASNSVGVAGDNTISTLAERLTARFDASIGPGQAGGTGMVAFNGAALSAQDFTVNGASAAAGAWARLGSRITLTGASSITIAANANPTFYTLQTAFLATISGSVGSIFGVTSGLPIGGLLSNGGTITSTGTTVDVTSSNGVGAYAGFNSATSTIDLTGGSIRTTGTSSFGLEAAENGRITAAGTSVTTSGGGAALFVAVFNTGPASIQLTNGTTVQANGADTAGLASLNLSGALTGQVEITGASLASAASAAVLAVGGPVDVTIADAATVTGNDRLIDAQFNASAPQATAVRMNASGASVLSGNAVADAQSTATISLATASRWTGASLNATRVDVDASSRWNVTDTSVLTDTLANAGTVAFIPPVSGFRTLTTTSYAGGGTLGLHTLVAGDGAPSDRLVIAGGTVTGTTAIVVTNTTGTGAFTAGNGILVVEAIGGTQTAPGAFTLAQPLVVGGYTYTLHRGSVDASGPQNWYLRSEDIPVPPVPPVPPTVAPIPATSPLALALVALGIALLARRRLRAT